MRYVRSPASVAACRRQTARTGIGGKFRLHNRFRTPAAGALTRAKPRAPRRGARSLYTPKKDNHPRFRRSVFRVVFVWVGPPHYFVKHRLGMAGDHWSPLQNQMKSVRKIKMKSVHRENMRITRKRTRFYVLFADSVVGATSVVKSNLVNNVCKDLVYTFGMRIALLRS